MADILFANNASSLLAVSVGTGDVSVQVAAGQGSLFPSPSGGDYFKVTLVDADGNIEICHCTSRSGDLLTVTRAQEGTTARAFTSGVTRVELRVTKATLEAMLQTNGDTDLPVVSGGTGASDASGARSNLGLGTMATQNANGVAITGGTIAGITDLPVADGGTGASSAAAARTNLGAAAASHTHGIGDLTGVAAASHTHSLADITDEGSFASKNITVSTSDPSGTPADGDIWVKYTP